MRRYNRGTEAEGVVNIVPPGQSIPKKQPRGIANQGDGTDQFPVPAVGWDSKEWAVVDAGVTHIEAAGTAVSVTDLSTLNAGLQGLAYLFPGGDADDNSWAVQWSVPDNIDVTKPIYVTIETIPQGS